MAIYHMSVKIVSRGGGRSATAAAAYRSGEQITDRRTGEEHDYTHRSGVEHTEIVAPDDAPDWASDRAELWNRVEENETRSDARLAREFEVALPDELGPEERVQLVREWVEEELVARGMVADIAIHEPSREGDERNHHAHVMVTDRAMGPDGFAEKKDPSWNSKATLAEWRESWADHVNRALERAGSPERVDHRSLDVQLGAAAERGDFKAAAELDREPGRHLGPAGTAIERREEREHGSRGGSSREGSDEARPSPEGDGRVRGAADGNRGEADRHREAGGTAHDSGGLAGAVERVIVAASQAIERVLESKLAADALAYAERAFTSMREAMTPKHTPTPVREIDKTPAREPDRDPDRGGGGRGR